MSNPLDRSTFETKSTLDTDALKSLFQSLAAAGIFPNAQFVLEAESLKVCIGVLEIKDGKKGGLKILLDGKDIAKYFKSIVLEKTAVSEWDIVMELHPGALMKLMASV